MQTSKLFLGGGSNILFTKNFDGIVIKISIGGIKIVDEDEQSVTVEAGAGVTWNELVEYCVEKNFGGIENLILIPGTVGAAPIQNIGAYGQELKDTFFELSGILTESGKEISFDKAACEFSYRSSIFKNKLKNKFVITSVKLRLKKNPVVNLSYKDVTDEIQKLNLSNASIIDVCNVVKSIRQRKLPDPAMIKNAGSFFKNPVINFSKFEGMQKRYPSVKYYPVDEENVKIPAAWLIEKCGFKGSREGNVGTHHTQPLVIVNYGYASGSEILSFAEKIKHSVMDKFEISLEFEVNII